MEIDLNSPGREAGDFLGMKIVLEIAKCLGRFSHQRIRLKIWTMIPSGMARNWRAVRPSHRGLKDQKNAWKSWFNRILHGKKSWYHKTLLFAPLSEKFYPPKDYHVFIKMLWIPFYRAMIVVQKWVWVKLTQYVVHDRKNKCGLKGLRAENTKNVKIIKLLAI